MAATHARPHPVGDIVTLFLFVVGAVMLVASVAAMVLDWTDSDAPIVTMLVGLVILIGAAVWQGIRDDKTCESRGGHMVPDGAPYYINSGGVLVPIQPERCEVP